MLIVPGMYWEQILKLPPPTHNHTTTHPPTHPHIYKTKGSVVASTDPIKEEVHSLFISSTLTSSLSLVVVLSLSLSAFIYSVLLAQY